MTLASLFSLAAFLLDGILVAAAFLSAYGLRFQTPWIPASTIPPFEGYLRFLVVVVPAHWLVFKYAGLYRQRRGITGVDEFPRILAGTVLSAVLIAASTFLIRSFSYSRLVIGANVLLSAAFLWAGRGILRRIQVALRRSGRGLTRLLVVGTGETARVAVERLRQDPGHGYLLVGAVSEGSGKRGPGGLRVVGTLDRLERAIAASRAGEVLFALPAAFHARLIPLLVRVQGTAVRYRIVSDLFGIVTRPLETDVLLGMPVFELKEAPLNRPGNRFLKRAFDLVLSSLALLFLTLVPVLPLTALLVRWTSPGPVLFRQRRVGRDGRVFEMLKFRSMRAGSESLAFTAKDDPRRTPIGAFLRRTSLDELPQLLNVLRGDMSLVGPRPEVPGLVERFGREVPRYFERHQVKSGITGWAQVNGLRGNTDLGERVRHDIYYIENWSLLLDVKILLRTALDLFEHRHAY
jgi:exopolysaccharide biosynthesis polyprenyl glycosylphosphotransferase